MNFKNESHITKLAAPDDSCFPGSDVSLGDWLLACQSDILGLIAFEDGGTTILRNVVSLSHHIPERLKPQLILDNVLSLARGALLYEY